MSINRGLVEKYSKTLSFKDDLRDWRTYVDKYVRLAVCIRIQFGSRTVSVRERDLRNLPNDQTSSYSSQQIEQ